jgi:hypothetical protein
MEIKLILSSTKWAYVKQSYTATRTELSSTVESRPEKQSYCSALSRSDYHQNRSNFHDAIVGRIIPPVAVALYQFISALLLFLTALSSSLCILFVTGNSPALCFPHHAVPQNLYSLPPHHR